MNISEIILNGQYKGIIPRPSAEEYEVLKGNIKAEGIKIPLVINSKNDLLDGYTRYQIAEEIQLSEVPGAEWGF